jgi:hypothetical protein
MMGTESPTPVRSIVNSVLLTLSILLMCKPAEAAQIELLSIQGLSIAKNQHIDKFEIHTWGVQTLAVCHLPTPAWRITAGTNGSPEGILSGVAGIGAAAYLPQSDLRRLEGLFLILVYGYQEYPRGDPKGQYHPATFAGSVHVGTYRSDSRGHKIRLAPLNFVRVPAAQCPAPASTAG